MIALKFQRYISVIWRMNPCMCVLSVPHWHVKWRKISSGISVTPSDNRKRNLCWCDVTCVPRPFKSSSTRLFVHPVFKLTSNKTLQLHVTGPLYPEARGFPNGKRRGNPFRYMTSPWSSWNIDIHRCSQNDHVFLNSALHKLILHVHVRCRDFTIVPVSALGVTL